MNRTLLILLTTVALVSSAPSNYCNSVACTSTSTCNGLLVPSLGGCCNICVQINGVGGRCTASSLVMGQLILPSFQGVCEIGLECVLGQCHKPLTLPLVAKGLRDFSRGLEALAVVNHDLKGDAYFFGKEYPLILSPGPVITPYLFHNHGSFSSKLNLRHNTLDQYQGNSPAYTYTKQESIFPTHFDPSFVGDVYHYGNSGPVTIHKRSIPETDTSSQEDSTASPGLVQNYELDSDIQAVKGDVNNDNRRGARAPESGVDSSGLIIEGEASFQNTFDASRTLNKPINFDNDGLPYQKLVSQSTQGGSFETPFGFGNPGPILPLNLDGQSSYFGSNHITSGSGNSFNHGSSQPFGYSSVEGQSSSSGSHGSSFGTGDLTSGSGSSFSQGSSQPFGYGSPGPVSIHKTLSEDSSGKKLDSLGTGYLTSGSGSSFTQGLSQPFGFSNVEGQSSSSGSHGSSFGTGHLTSGSGSSFSQGSSQPFGYGSPGPVSIHKTLSEDSAGKKLDSLGTGYLTSGSGSSFTQGLSQPFSFSNVEGQSSSSGIHGSSFGAGHLTSGSASSFSQGSSQPFGYGSPGPASIHRILSEDSAGTKSLGINGFGSPFSQNTENQQSLSTGSLNKQIGFEGEGPSSTHFEGGFSGFIPNNPSTGKLAGSDDQFDSYISGPIMSAFLNAMSNSESSDTGSQTSWWKLWNRMQKYFSPSILRRLFSMYFPNGFYSLLKSSGSQLNSNSKQNDFDPNNNFHSSKFISSDFSGHLGSSLNDYQSELSMPSRDGEFSGSSTADLNRKSSQFSSGSNSRSAGIKGSSVKNIYDKANSVISSLYDGFKGRNSFGSSLELSKVFKKKQGAMKDNSMKELHEISINGFENPSHIMKSDMQGQFANSDYDPFGFGSPGPVKVQGLNQSPEYKFNNHLSKSIGDSAYQNIQDNSEYLSQYGLSNQNPVKIEKTKFLSSFKKNALHDQFDYGSLGRVKSQKPAIERASRTWSFKDPYGYGNLGPVQYNSWTLDKSHKTGQSSHPYNGITLANGVKEYDLSNSGFGKNHFGNQASGRGKNHKNVEGFKTAYSKDPYGYGNLGPVRFQNKNFEKYTKSGYFNDPYGYGNLGPVNEQKGLHPEFTKSSHASNQQAIQNQKSYIHSNSDSVFHNDPFGFGSPGPVSYQKGYLKELHGQNNHYNPYGFGSPGPVSYQKDYLKELHGQNNHYNPYGFGSLGPVSYQGALSVDSLNAASSDVPYGYPITQDKYFLDQDYDPYGYGSLGPVQNIPANTNSYGRPPNPNSGPLSMDFEARRKGHQQWPDDSISLTLDTGSAISTAGDLLQGVSKILGQGSVQKNECGSKCDLLRTLDGLSLGPGPIVVAPSDTDVRIANNFFNSLEPGPVLPNYP